MKNDKKTSINMRVM